MIAAWLMFRYSRPMRMSIGRMWVGPALILVMTAALIWGEEQNAALAPPVDVLAGALVAGFLAGVPFGILRGMHTTVKATDRAGVMYLGPSWIVAAIWLLAFGARIGLRFAFAGTSFAMPLGDGLLMLALGMVVTSYYVIYQKYRGLEHQAGQI